MIYQFIPCFSIFTIQTWPCPPSNLPWQGMSQSTNHLPIPGKHPEERSSLINDLIVDKALILDNRIFARSAVNKNEIIIPFPPC